jgi:perosamine synthetase
MTWRRQPPVMSPVSTRGLVSAGTAVLGMGSPSSVVATNLLRTKYSAEDALLTDSGTSALVLALKKCVPHGGTVAFPGYGCIDLTAAALAAGVKVRLYDLNPSTLSPDLDSVRRAIARGVGAILVAHFYGYPADVAAVSKLASAAGLPLIEDAAQGAGGSLLGKRLGALADISVLSFGRGKGTTAGNGGALLVRTPSLAQWLRDERAKLERGRKGASTLMGLAAQRIFSAPHLYAFPASAPWLRLGEMVYHPAGRPREMDAAATAILPHALKMEGSELLERRNRAAILTRLVLSGNGIAPIRAVPGGESGYLRFAVTDVIGARQPRADLGALRGYPQTLEEHRELRPILLEGERAGSGSVFLRDRLFTLPTHSFVDRRCLDDLASWMGRELAPLQALVAV